MGKKKRRGWSRLTPTTYLRSAISLSAVAVIVMREVWPELRLDAVSLGLLLVALLPWLGRIFKSIKLPGGYEFTYADFDELADDVPKPPAGDATAAGRAGAGSAGAAYLDVRGFDPNLALVGLRIEVESALQRIWNAEPVDYGDPPRSAARLLAALTERNVIDNRFANVLREVIHLGNMAAHGENPPPGAYEFAFDVGPQMLDYLASLPTARLGGAAVE